MTIQDSNLKLLIKEAFRLIAAREGISKKDVWQRYAERFHISEHTVRGWEAGLTRPQEAAQIEELAADAITIGKVDERWLRSYLQSQGIPRIAKDLQERLYDLLETQLRKDANFATGPQSISIKFANGRTVKTIITRHSSELGQALEILNAQFDHPVMVVVGGADGLSEERSKRIETLVEEVVVPFCETNQITVIDGATNSGVMALLGRARQKLGSTFPLIGIAPKGCVRWQDEAYAKSQMAPLEPNHSHFLLVPGSEWSDESLWISRVAHMLASGKPEMTLVINGGEVTWQDVVFSLTAGRVVVALEGSGRAADALAMSNQELTGSARARAFQKLGLIRHIRIDKKGELKKLLSNLLLNISDSS